ncbi:ATP-binding protein [Dactylosporangium sp. NPDC051485]|uniref:ATP-binding protein n=1 Tax=Dactylosporangium sp. NPDC051485 TaxID=3154846 RepID=UPI003425E8FA
MRDDDTVLNEQVRSASRAHPVEDSLSTDQRVLARVTDGIYRRPASALRELISNAYDADARRVTIRTERPDFGRISIDDDGNGMSSEALVRLLKHIGGSTKRTAMGETFNVTRKGDPNLSPGGRPLIGKIGIGLFSVAQLTQAFQIVTKVAGENHQTIAYVILRQYAESVTSDPEAKYEAGKFRIWRERAEDTQAHGTSITLTAIRPQTRESLQSKQKWLTLLARANDGGTPVELPEYHVGRIDPSNPDLLQQFVEDEPVRLPWKKGAEGYAAMEGMVQAVWKAYSEEGIQNPSVEKLFDEYLEMIWTLSLAPPIRYIGGHPFDLMGAENLRLYRIDPKGVTRLEFDNRTPVRQLAGLGNKIVERSDFEVQIDEVSLSRPIYFDRFLLSSATLQESLLFVASHRETFPGIDGRMSGGNLEFQAYVLISPKVVPTEHRGVKIRINDASGIPFDPTFLSFPIAETQRLPRITCEIFVTEGLDGALNIDRESFNFAHAHVRALTKWLHSALRKVIAEEKRVAASARRQRRSVETTRSVDEVREIVEEVRRQRLGPDLDDPPAVTFVSSGRSSSQPPGAYQYPRSVVAAAGANYQERENKAVAFVTAITQVLDAYGLLDDLAPEDRTLLLKSIKEISEKLG